LIYQPIIDHKGVHFVIKVDALESRWKAPDERKLLYTRAVAVD